MATGAPPGAFRNAHAAGWTVVWVAESGFYLLPAVVRTYAPRGQTPVLPAPLSGDHLSVISGVTSAGRLLVQVQARPYRGPTIVGFLRHRLRQIAAPLLVRWDGASIHRAQPVKDFLATAEGTRIQVERLPGYAPAVNPDAGVWQHLKRGEWRNVVCHSVAARKRERRLAIARLRRKPQVLHGCFTHCGYEV